MGGTSLDEKSPNGSLVSQFQALTNLSSRESEQLMRKHVLSGLKVVSAPPSASDEAQACSIPTRLPVSASHNCTDQLTTVTIRFPSGLNAAEVLEFSSELPIGSVWRILPVVTLHTCALPLRIVTARLRSGLTAMSWTPEGRRSGLPRLLAVAESQVCSVLSSIVVSNLPSGLIAPRRSLACAASLHPPVRLWRHPTTAAGQPHRNPSRAACRWS